MAIYVEEEDVWKCPKHQSRRRRNGVCPACLRDRLGSLCPDCGAIRPCNCPCAASTASSSSSSSGEPSFRRSRSLAVPFLRSNNKTPSFLSGLMRSKTTRTDPLKGAIGGGHDENSDSNDKIEDFARMVTRSRSVSAAATLTASGSLRRQPKTKFWNFSSPFKVFRTSKNTTTVLHDRPLPPLHRPAGLTN